MTRYIMRRLNLLIITLLIIVFIAFAFGQTQHLNGVDTSMNLRTYWDFIARLLSGDWGTSSVSGKPIYPEMIAVLPATLELCFAAFLVSFIVGIPLGSIAGMHKKQWMRNTIMSITLVAHSIPIFWLALVLVMSLSLQMGWFPVSGRMDLLLDYPHPTGFALIDAWFAPADVRDAAISSVISHMAIPTLVLAVVPTTEVIRQVTISLGNVMQQNYVKTALTKGFSRWKILIDHGLRNAIPPILPNLGWQFGSVLTTTMILEVVFDWPGVGRWLINAIYQQDYAAIQGGMLAISGIVIFTTVATDIFTTLIYPLHRKEIYEH
ncbi:ABC transporter permease subunit [Alginatibacterium sediminis]|uniref:ABC transporter permease subunit n=1 Tax=Alginatibacterium sediminis TaxID=2164068 RepID=A0A420EGY6_9ALTE|nr:ABC transporter permease subunit [Alginatibacterium sediminis]RKF19816.1 ABC transporter permease subunit [Alginatibacterium sediminis]